MVGAGADAIIASYGTIRDLRDSFGNAAPILKLDMTTVTLGSSYALTEYVPTWTIDVTRTARWDRYSHPEKLPEYSYGFPDIWWFDKAKAAKVGVRQ